MFFLAIRQLISKKKQSILTLVSITLGSTAYVVISGMMIGFQDFIIDQLMSNDAHVRVSARTEAINSAELEQSLFLNDQAVKWIVPPSGRKELNQIEHPQGWFQRLKNHPSVLAYVPQIKVQAIARRGYTSVAIQLMGTIPERQVLVTKMEDNMVHGRFLDLSTGGNKIVVGDGLLSRLGSRAGESIQIVTSSGDVTPARITGVFHFGIKSIDDNTAFGHLADIQKINKSPSRVTDIAIKLNDVSQAADLASSWQKVVTDLVQSWDQANEGFLSVFKTQDIVRNAMTLTILVVAGFGIYNILSMSIAQRRREIAILRSIGYESHDIVNLFLSQGVILGTLGGLIGMLFGYIICRYLSTVEISKQRGFGAGTMMMSYSAVIYIKAFLLAFGASTFAGWLPARAAGKLTPMDIIRSEAS